MTADGKIFYGTQNLDLTGTWSFAELWELKEIDLGWTRQTRLASWDAMPVTLAQDSESGEAMAELVDVNNGTSEKDYAGKDVRGKIVLAAAQPGAVAPLAVERMGAAGIISYAHSRSSSRNDFRSTQTRVIQW